MKQISLQGIILGILVLSIYACETRDDSIAINAESAPIKKKKTTFSCEDLLSAPEDFKGKVVELNAITWGLSESADGEEILMSIDDEKLQGLQQAHVLVHFSKDQSTEINNFKENDSISLTATVGAYEHGALRLVNATVKSD